MDIIHPKGSHVTNSLGAGVVTPAAVTGANSIVCQAIDQDIRFTIDGETDPSGSTGFKLIADDPPTIIPNYNGEVRFIRGTSGAVLEYQFGLYEE